MSKLRWLSVGFAVALLTALVPHATAQLPDEPASLQELQSTDEFAALVAAADRGVPPVAVPGLSTSAMLRQRLAFAGVTLPASGNPEVDRYVDVVNAAIRSTEYRTALAALQQSLDDPALAAQLDAVAPSEVPLLWLLPVDGFAVSMGFNPMKVLERVGIIIGTVVVATGTCLATVGVGCVVVAVGSGIVVASTVVGLVTDSKEDLDPSGEGGKVLITNLRCETYFRCAVEWHAAYDGHSLAHANTYFITRDYNGTHSLEPNDPACRNPTYQTSLCIWQETTVLGTHSYQYNAYVAEMYGLYCSESIEVIVRVTWSNGDYATDTMGVPKQKSTATSCTP